MNPLEVYWAKIPLKWQEEIVSASHTFISAVIVELLLQLQASGSFLPTGKGALLALGATAVRSGWKAMINLFISQSQVQPPVTPLQP